MKYVKRTAFLVALVFSLLILADAFASLTSISITSPSENEYISGSYKIITSITGTATNVSFWNSSNGITWSFIGINTTPGATASYKWDTTSIRSASGIIIKANASNATTTVSTQKTGITVDNIYPILSSVYNATPVLNGTKYNITITWTTQEYSNTSLNYSFFSSFISSVHIGRNDYVKLHEINISEISESSPIYYKVQSCDRAKNCNISIKYLLSMPQIAPHLSNLTETANSTALVLRWNTHENSNKTVNYGTTKSLGTSTSNSTFGTVHSTRITNLVGGIKYYYNITLCDVLDNCNTTGPYNETLPIDSIDPIITNTLINGSTTKTIHTAEKINITAYVRDNNRTSSVWAYFQFADGTTANQTMTNITGAGTTTSPGLYSIIYTVTKGGTHNITIYAKDAYNNSANGTKINFTAYGYFVVTANISDTYKNFSYGILNNYTLTITNTNNVTENYTITTTGSSATGWNVTQNTSTLRNIAAGSSGYVKIIVGIPKKPVNDSVITTRINSTSDYSTTKQITFQRPKITIKLPKITYMSNMTNKTNITYYYYNSTKISSTSKFWKIINISGIDIVNSDTDGSLLSTANMTCSLWQGKKFKYKGNYSKTLRRCTINATNMVTGLYNLTINATHPTKAYNGTNRTQILLPSAITITADNISTAKSADFYITGRVKYNDLVNAPFIRINETTRGCTTNTLYDGTFKLTCSAPSIEGNYDLKLVAVGVWNVTGTKTIKLTVMKAVPQKEIKTIESRYIQLNLSESELILNENKTVELKILNNKTEQMTYTIQITTNDNVRRFDYDYEKTAVIDAKQTKIIDINFKKIENTKPGTYTLTIKVPEEEIETTIKIIVPEPTYPENDVSINRYFEDQKDNSSSKIYISIKNTKQNPVSIKLTEIISKDVAGKVSDIIFGTQPTNIIQDDPIVYWELELKAGESRDISYTVKKIASAFVFETPTSIIEELLQEEPNITIEGEGKIKIIITIAVAVIALIIILIIYKNELGKLFKKKPKTEMIQVEKFESPYPGRKAA